MKSLLASAFVLSVLAIGCSKESAPGGPGAKPTGTTPEGKSTSTTPAGNDNTFTLKVPATDVNVKQGENSEITISIDRGSKFQQKVDVKLDVPAGVTATPATITIPSSDKEAKVQLSAAADAAIGKHAVKATATPETGTPVSETFNIEVKENK